MPIDPAEAAAVRELWASHSADRLDRLSAAGVHLDPEAYCHRCGGPNMVWVAPSPLWNEIMRGGDINGLELHDGIVCPTCFAIIGEAAGTADLWELSAGRVHRPLQTVTPSGRVWDEATRMWVNEPADVREVLDALDAGPP